MKGYDDDSAWHGVFFSSSSFLMLNDIYIGTTDVLNTVGPMGPVFHILV